MKGYRIHIVDDIVYGELEVLVGENKDCYETEMIKIENRELYDGMLYCPEVDMIVDEIDMFLINKEIDQLTIVSTENGHKLRSLNDMSQEELNRYFDLQDKYDHYYDGQVKFVKNGFEKQYLEKLEKVLEGDN